VPDNLVSNRLTSFSAHLAKPLESSGKLLGMLPLVFVLIQFTVTLLVYVFAAEVTKLKDSLFYINALMIFGAAGYTALYDEHVRVDIFHGNFSAKTQALVTLAGSLFLMFPMVIYLAYQLWPTVLLSWNRLEGSVEAGGLPIVFILKTIPLLFTISLLLSGLMQVSAAIATLLGSTKSDQGDT